MKNLLILSLTVFILASCGRSKEIIIELPPYDSKISVECYLEPGKPYRLTLTESVSYFESPDLPTIDSALVIVTHNSTKDTLKFGPAYDGVYGKLYNYTSESIVPFDYTSEFHLWVQDKKGRTVTSKTVIPQPVPVDSVKFRFNNDTLAFPLVYFKDIPGTKNFYRYLLIRDTYLGDVLADYILDDVLFQTSEQAVGSGFDLEPGDHIYIRLHHITEDFYNFLVSADAARDANGNPFGQPAVIRSNINGGLGIFTGLSYSELEMDTPAMP